MDEVINDCPIVSVITKMEVLGFNSPAKVQKVLASFFDDAQVLPINEAVTSQTIVLRKKYKIKLPDAIIAATAMVNELALITRNVKDFQRIDGLTCLDVHQYGVR